MDKFDQKKKGGKPKTKAQPLFKKKLPFFSGFKKTAFFLFFFLRFGKRLFYQKKKKISFFWAFFFSWGKTFFFGHFLNGEKKGPISPQPFLTSKDGNHPIFGYSPAGTGLLIFKILPPGAIFPFFYFGQFNEGGGEGVGKRVFFFYKFFRASKSFF